MARWIARGVVALVLLAALAFVIPGSPLYLPTLGSHGYDGRSERQWIKALSSPDAVERQRAAYALGMIASVEGVPGLARVLTEDLDVGARIEAGLALSKLSPASRDAVPALARALTDVEPLVRMNAALALFRLGAEAKSAVPALIEALAQASNRTNANMFPFTVQEMSARALGRATAGTTDGVAALTLALDTADAESMAMAVARALGEVGPAARSAAPKLQALLKDNSKSVRQAAAEALESIGMPAAPEEKTPAGSRLELPEAERAYIWEIEHRGNLLVKHGFAPLAKALQGSDAAALKRFLAADFAAADLRGPRRIRTVTEYAEVERLEDTGQAPLPLAPEAFIARLFEFRKVFPATPPQVKFALMTLSPKQRGQLEGPWEGTALLRLHGETAKDAPAEVVVNVRYELTGLSEEILKRPGWLRGLRIEQVLVGKAPRYFFAEVARQRGIDTAKIHDNWKSSDFHAMTGGVYVCDFNRDGILDLLITDINGCALYQGRADGSFVDVTVPCGLPQGPMLRTGAAWADLDGDGWEDLILADRIYRNDSGKRFVDVTERSSLRLPSDWVNLIVADYDRDGKLDLYVTRTGRPGQNSWLEDKSGDSKGNYLFRNHGNWQFEDVTARSGAFGGYRSTFTAAWLDANNDGWPDLHVINEFGDGVLLVNNQNGTFSEHRLADRPADFGSMGLAVGDINNDGHIDIYCNNMYSKAGTRVIGNLAPDAYPPQVMERMRRFVAGSQLHLNKGGLKFDQVGAQKRVAGVGWAYGACLADLDNDGWLDLYATAGFVSKSRDKPDG